MAREISFDYDRAIEKATRIFWRDGYEGASLRDLLKSMGIGEGSFYNTMKSKRHLYVECAKHYGATEGKKRISALTDAADASAGVRAMFAVMLDCLDDPKTPSRLCMAAGMVAEEVLADTKLKKFVSEALVKFEERVFDRLQGDKDAGVLGVDFDTKTVAAVITTYLQGLWRMAMVDYDRPRFERQIDVFVSGLGL